MSPVDESMRPIRDALAAFGGVRVTACSDGHAGTETFHVAMRIDSIDMLARFAHALPLQFSEERRGVDAASRGLGIVLIIRGIDAANRLDVILESPPMSHEEETLKPYTIRFADSEVAAVRDITKVDAVATAVRSIVLKEIERHKSSAAR